MEKIKVLFLNLASGKNEFKQDYEETLNQIRSSTKINLKEVSSLVTVKEELTDSVNLKWDVLVVWVDSSNSSIKNELANLKDEYKTLEHLGIVIIFGFHENVQEHACDAMLREMYAFACPFNSHILEACIESMGLETKNSKSLSEFKKYLLEAKKINVMVDRAFLELETNPIVGYDRATISLIDNETGQRYLLKHDPLHPNPDRQLLKVVHEDNLIENVDRKGVLVIDNLKDLRDNNPTKLDELGWENKDATNDINSWVGVSAKRQHKSVAIITLDHRTPGHYARYNDKLVRFLKGFGEILADAIVDFLLARNARVVREITREIGDALKSEALMRQILVKLRDELECDNCTYFKVSSSIRSEVFLEEWVAANNSNTSEEQSASVKRSFKKGMGIVGCVLADGKSRIVPNALESEEFEPTLYLPGTNLSMLAVPVIPYLDKNGHSQSSRIIGVISCHKERKDHFTVYDRDLVEAIAQSTATVIERTMTLEYSNDISSKMNDLMFNTDKANLLRKICEHALKITSARAAVIHRLKYSRLPNGKEEYRPTGECYAFPELIEAPLPRLDGQGTTDIVIREKKTREFSERFVNSSCISEELRSLGVKYQIVVPLTIKNEAEQQHLIGALYLNKYSEVPFSEVEKFALELFASQAASTIYFQEFLFERLTWTKANTDLAMAIEAIASSNDTPLLLKDIVRYAHSLVDASFGYLALLIDDNNFEFKAAWPEYILTELDIFHSKKENFTKKDGSCRKGITGLAAMKRQTILLSDLQKEKEDSEYWQEYIEFRKGTRSELVVPIIDSNKVIGVINLEHEKPYAFTEVHKEVIEHFARQVAIAFQKKSLVESVSRQKNILIGLQRSLQKIIESPSQNMLQSAVLLTKEAVEAHEVIVIPIEIKNNKSEISTREIVPDVVGNNQSLIHSLRKVSLQVFDQQKPANCPDVENRSNSNQKQINELLISSGLCIPFSSRNEKIGVMWILFSKPFAKDLSEEDKAMYQVYANQIALAYTSAKQSEKLEQKLSSSTFKLTANVDHNYKDTRRQASIYFTISVCTSIAALILIFYGIFPLINKNDKRSQTVTAESGIAAVIAVLLQGITVLALNRGKAANERTDRYHRELYNVSKLQILLSATEQLDPETAPKVKQQIIQTATNSWIESVSEIKNVKKPE